MNKIVKYGLLGTGATLGVAIAGVVYIAANFNPNDYKDQIIQSVKESKQRNLLLDGDIKLTFFPRIGADLGKVSLSESNSDKQFAAIETLSVSLAVLPLLSKQVVVDAVLVSGVTAKLIKYKDGTTNIDDLLGKDKSQDNGKPPVEFDIASITVENTNLTYLDEASGGQYALENLNLKTGRIANGVPGKIDLSVMVKASQSKVDINTQLKTTLTFDLDKQKFDFADMDLQLSGAAMDISNLQIKAAGDASVNLGAQEFATNKFTLNGTGIKGKDNFDVTLDAPSLSLANGVFTGEKLIFNAKLNGESGDIAAVLSIPEITGDDKTFKIGALTMDLDVKQPEQTFKVKLATPVTGNLQTQQFDLSNLVIGVNATGDKLPNKSVSSEMKGSVQLDMLKQSVRANLAGGLLQSQIKAKVGVVNFANPAIDFDVEVDQFDADLYLPKKTAEAKTDRPEQPLDLSALRKLNLNGSLRIGQLKVANVKSSQLRLDVKAHNGVVNVNPLTANLYKGSTSGSLSVNAQATPAIRINQKLNGIDVAALTKDAADFDTLEGRGNVGVDIAMQGNTVSQMKKTLGGNMSLNLTDGAIKGINIAKKLRDAQGMFGKSQTQNADQTEKTDFSELKATFKINKGVAHNDDLSMKSPLLRLSGNGDINIGNDSMDYVAKATLAKTLEGQGGKDSVAGITVPVRVSGPFADLKYTLDFGAMVSDSAKQKVEAKKEEVKAKVQDQLQNSLKGLFR